MRRLDSPHDLRIIVHGIKGPPDDHESLEKARPFLCLASYSDILLLVV